MDTTAEQDKFILDTSHITPFILLDLDSTKSAFWLKDLSFINQSSAEGSGIFFTVSVPFDILSFIYPQICIILFYCYGSASSGRVALHMQMLSPTKLIASSA